MGKVAGTRKGPPIENPCARPHFYLSGDENGNEDNLGLGMRTRKVFPNVTLLPEKSR